MPLCHSEIMLRGILPRLGLQFPKPYFVLVPTIEQFLLRHLIECLGHLPADPLALKPYQAGSQKKKGAG